MKCISEDKSDVRLQELINTFTPKTQPHGLQAENALTLTNQNYIPNSTRESSMAPSEIEVVVNGQS